MSTRGLYVSSRRRSKRRQREHVSDKRSRHARDLTIKNLYKLRHRVENTLLALKRWRGTATLRCGALRFGPRFLPNSCRNHLEHKYLQRRKKAFSAEHDHFGMIKSTILPAVCGHSTPLEAENPCGQPFRTRCGGNDRPVSARWEQRNTEVDRTATSAGPGVRLNCPQ